MANISISEIQQEISNPADLDGNELFLISDVNDSTYTSCKVKLNTVKDYIESTLPKQPGYVRIEPLGTNGEVTLSMANSMTYDSVFEVENNVFKCRNSIVEFGKIDFITTAPTGSFANVINCTVYMNISDHNVLIERVVRDSINTIHIFEENTSTNGLYIDPDTLDPDTVIICTTQKVYKRNGEIIIENLE